MRYEYEGYILIEMFNKYRTLLSKKTNTNIDYYEFKCLFFDMLVYINIFINYLIRLKLYFN